MIPVINGYDATGQNEHVLPKNAMVAGYDTQVGSGYQIRWTTVQYASHTVPYPALHIDQNPGASDYLSDYLDIETGAASDSEIVRWVTNARLSYVLGKRPGQRWPGLYCSVSNVNGAVVVLHNANMVNVPFVVADYSVSEAEATRRVQTAIGPYPAVGYQYTDKAFDGLADANIWSVPWITNTSVEKTGETEMISGELTERASCPFPAGAYKQLVIGRDFNNANSTSTVRVAVRSATKGYNQIETFILNTNGPVSLSFRETDTDMVSLVLESGNIPVGYTIA